MDEYLKVEGARGTRPDWLCLGSVTEYSEAQKAIESAMARGGYCGFRITRVTQEVVYLCEQKMRMEVIISKGV